MISARFTSTLIGESTSKEIKGTFVKVTSSFDGPPIDYGVLECLQQSSNDPSVVHVAAKRPAQPLRK
jgi:hypothetical protein